MRKRGFTLAELLVVIALIGVIAAVLIPQIFKIYNASKDKIVETYNQETQVINLDTENNILTDTTGYKMVDIKYGDNVIYCYFELDTD